ncbi:hypothetical protein D3C87_261090 [compost metagenome]|jgi:hypothetical protein
MESLFRDFWWLVFPLAWIVGGGVSSFFRYRRQKGVLDLMRTYAERGQEPPEALLKMVGEAENDVDLWDTTGRSSSCRRRPADYWSLFGLFFALAVGFAATGYFTGIDGGSGAFMVVGVTMGAVAIWALINAIARQGGRS